MSHAEVRLTIITGAFAEEDRTVILPLDAETIEELSAKLELSDDPFSRSVASTPGQDYVMVRRAKLSMRQKVADDIGRGVAAALMREFGRRDVRDGYTRADLRQMETEEPLDPAQVLNIRQGRNRTL